MLRELKGTQRLPRLLAFRVDADATTPVIVDHVNDATLTRNGAGDYTLTFRAPFKKVPVCVASALNAAVHSATLISASVTAVRVLIADGSNAAADVDFHVLVCGWDAADIT